MAYTKINILRLALLLFLSKLSEAESPCTSKKSCSECIQMEKCARCMQPNYQNPRCFNTDALYEDINEICNESYLWNPQNEESSSERHEITAIDRFSSSSYESSFSASTGSASFSAGLNDKTVMISPQRLNLKLRLNKRYSFPIKYSHDYSVSFPVDLYYLMDLSKSMNEEGQKLHNLGKIFAEYLPNITTDFNLGIGSFVNEDRNDQNENFFPSIGYRNIMALSQDSQTFYEIVKNSSLLNKLHVPQKGLENLMQALVCQQQIGWRKTATKFLIYSISSGFHSASNRKYGKFAIPNDGECHFDKNGLYKPPQDQNYPTISQINQKAKENSINIIFTATPQQFSKYKELSDHIVGSSVGVLSSDSSNVLDLVHEQYSKASSMVQIKHNATSPIEITYESSCPNANYDSRGKKCTDFKYGDVVSFNAFIIATFCPKKAEERFQTVEIQPIGVKQSLIVNVEIMCDCPCERGSKTNHKNSARNCSGSKR